MSTAKNTMTKLGERNIMLIKQGLKAQGIQNPDDVYFYIEEQLYTDESTTIRKFINWYCSISNDIIKHAAGDYEKLFKKFLDDTNSNMSLEQYIETIKDVIEIEIPKVSGISPRVVNKNITYATLNYSSTAGFYINTSGNHLDHEGANKMSSKLIILAAICENLNKLYQKI